MKFESMILASLFVARFALCTLVMGAMLTASPRTVTLAGAQHSAIQSATTPGCAMATSATTCPDA
jgi:hypothetical protein